MSVEEMLALGAAGILLTLVEISPVKINPWKTICKGLRWCAAAFGRALNADVLDKLTTVEQAQKDTADKLASHIRLDDFREADKIRARILTFNRELLTAVPHTEEEFIEILAKIDEYNAFCKDHEDYKNSRAIHAIANILRVYDERLAKHDFL
jgi:hypothetical protein